MVQQATEPFSPRLTSGERVFMRISENDNSKIRRGSKDYFGEVTDQLTGKVYDIYGADCGLYSCVCDAVAILKDKE